MYNNNPQENYNRQFNPYFDNYYMRQRYNPFYRTNTGSYYNSPHNYFNDPSYDNMHQQNVRDMFPPKYRQQYPNYSPMSRDNRNNLGRYPEYYDNRPSRQQTEEYLNGEQGDEYHNPYEYGSQQKSYPGTTYLPEMYDQPRQPFIWNNRPTFMRRGNEMMNQNQRPQNVQQMPPRYPNDDENMHVEGEHNRRFAEAALPTGLKPHRFAEVALPQMTRPDRKNNSLRINPEFNTENPNFNYNGPNTMPEFFDKEMQWAKNIQKLPKFTRNNSRYIRE